MPVNFLPGKLTPLPAGLMPRVHPIGFSDDIIELKGKLDPRSGAVMIPNGREWLAREIPLFVRELTAELFPRPALAAVRFWQQDLDFGLQEGLLNSFAHAVREKGRVWVNWQISSDKALFAVTDEGHTSFNLYTKSSLKIITDSINQPLAGRGIGMQYIRRAADEVQVLPITRGNELYGNRLLFVKFFPLSTGYPSFLG